MREHDTIRHVLQMVDYGSALIRLNKLTGADLGVNNIKEANHIVV